MSLTQWTYGLRHSYESCNDCHHMIWGVYVIATKRSFIMMISYDVLYVFMIII